MTLLHALQSSFNSGELSPHLLGRVDIGKYAAGAKQILNWIVRPDGSLARRSGTRYVAEEMDSATKGRIIPFIFSTEQAYILELGDQRARFYKDEGMILAHTKTFVDGDVDVANDEINIASHFYADQQGPFQLETTGTLPGGLYTGTNYWIVNSGLTNSPASDYIGLSLTKGGAKVGITGASGGGTHSIVPAATTPHEIVLPYTADEIYDLHFTQSADVIYIAHENHHPRTLTRTGHSSWALSLLDMQDGPYLPKWRLVAGGPTKFCTWLSAATSGNGVLLTCSQPYLDATRDLNRMIRLVHYGYTPAIQAGAARIVQINSTTQALIDIKKDFVTIAATGTYQLGAWYASSNWPRTVEFYQQRLGYAATPAEPERIDLSQTSNYVDFGPTEPDETVIDSNALSYKVAGARDVQVVRWMVALRNLIIGTTSGLWPVLAASVDEVVTPTNIQLSRSSRIGTSNQQPVTSSGGVFYLSRSARKLWYADYDIARDGYSPEDLTLLAEHITGSGLTGMAYALEPSSILWNVRSDGVLAALTFERAQEIWGWHRHELGGTFGAGSAVVESIAVIPSPAGDHDQLWLTVKRTINGSTRRYVEFLEQPFADADDIESAFFVDSGLTYDVPVAISGATQANPVVVTATAHGFSNGQSVRITHVQGMDELNERSFTVASATPNTFALSGVDGTGYTAYASGGEVRAKVGAVSGLGHLEGETVSILGDGAVQPQKVVSGGSITLERAASEVHVGLAFVSDLETLPLGQAMQDGSVQDRKKRPTHALIRLHRSLGLMLGKNEDELEALPFRVPEDYMDASPPLFTGLMRTPLIHGHDEDAHLFFRKEDPLPCEILSVLPIMGVSSR